MAFLLRVELPDVPGSLGALAGALGSAGADIHAIEIVEHSEHGRAIDDVLLELPPTVMPDALVTACHKLDGVRVQWVSRYNAGANLSMDLEAVEAFTEDPKNAIARLVDVVPSTFRADWALALTRTAGEPEVVCATATAPELVAAVSGWFDIDKAQRLATVDEWDSTVLAGTVVRERDLVVVFGRHGGPEILNSELARLGHLVALAASVSATA